MKLKNYLLYPYGFDLRILKKNITKILSRFFSPILFSLSIIINCFTGCATVEKKSVDIVKPDISILFAGDVMLDWGIKDIVDEKGADYPVKDLKAFLDGFDFRFCNLECPVTEADSVHPDKIFVFRGKPDHVDLLKYAGIDAVSLANNHSSDYGNRGLLDTIKNLSGKGIKTAGAGKSRKAASEPVIFYKNNIKIGILAYTTIGYTDSFAQEDYPGVASGRIGIIKRDILRLKNNFDFIIVSIHWGEEYSEYPDDRQVSLGHSIIDSGADAVIGHHPHIIQGVEIYNNKPIIYSLGNFIFGSIHEDLKDNILAGISFEGKRLKSLRIYPINTNRLNSPFQYWLLKGNEGSENLNYLIKLSEPLNSDFTKKAVITGSFLEYVFK